MTRRTRWYWLAPLGFVLVASGAALAPVALAPGSSAVGAPWVALETPANPLDAATRGAALVVRVYYHARPADLPISGTAEGLVDGRRQSVPLEFTPTGTAGVYALRQQWPAKGQWLLAVSVDDGRWANMVVELGPDGGISDGGYLEWQAKAVALRSVRVVRQLPDAAAVDRALRTLARQHAVAVRSDR